MNFKQHEQVLNGTKTQTRRLVKEREFMGPDEVRKWKDRLRRNTFAPALDWSVKWAVGRTYAVQPGRGQPVIMYKVDPSGSILTWDWSRADSRLSVTETKQQLKSLGWREARIRITEVRRERLQDISEEDAIAEGMFKELHPIALKPVTRYMQLWDSIHTKPGTRWADDPEVWALTFELAQRA